MKTNHNNAVSELVTAPTREQSVLGWAIHCDLIDSRDIDEEFVKSILERLKEFSDLAYAAGQNAERKEIVQREICKLSLLADVSRRGVELGQKLEREACARVCEDFADGTSAYEVHHRFAAYKCADLIRKRGKNESIS